MFIVKEPELAGRALRDAKLAKTDHIVPVTDHGLWGEIMQYRQALRDWPDTADFPNNIPQSPLEGS